MKRKYRIKHIKYKSGRVEYLPQVRICFFWFNIGYKGEIDFFASFPETCLDDAYKRIKLNRSGNTEKINVKFKSCDE